MIDFLVKYFKILLVYALSAVQTLLGWYMFSPLMMDGSDVMWSSYIFGMVIHIAICLFVIWLRVGEIEFMFWPIVFEILLSPIAVLRTLISFGAWIFRRESPELDFDLPSGTWDMMVCFLFHIY